MSLPLLLPDLFRLPFSTDPLISNENFNILGELQAPILNLHQYLPQSYRKDNGIYKRIMILCMISYTQIHGPEDCRKSAQTISFKGV